MSVMSVEDETRIKESNNHFSVTDMCSEDETRIKESNNHSSVTDMCSEDETRVKGSYNYSSVTSWEDETHVKGSYNHSSVTNGEGETRVKGHYNYSSVASEEEETHVKRCYSHSSVTNGEDETRVKGRYNHLSVTSSKDETLVKRGYNNSSVTNGEDETRVKGSYNHFSATNSEDETCVKRGYNNSGVTSSEDETHLKGRYNQSSVTSSEDETRVKGSYNNSGVSNAEDKTRSKGSYNHSGVTSCEDETRVKGSYNKSTVTHGEDETHVNGSDDYLSVTYGKDKTRREGSTNNSSFSYSEDKTHAEGSKDQSRCGNVYNIHSCNVQIISGSNSNVHMNNFDSYHGHEELLMKSFQQMKDVFVETNQYLTAREIFLKKRYMILIGSSGVGKSFIAKKLIHGKVREGYQFKEINSGHDLQTLGECKKTVLLLDDAFRADNPDTQFLISEMEDFIDENKLKDNSIYIVITSRTHQFSEVQKKTRMPWLLDNACIVDLGKIELKKDEKRNIIERHIQKFKPQDGASQNIIDEIVKVDCIGFPNYAYLFVRNDKWFAKGVAFFVDSNEIIQKEIDNLRHSDPNIYLFLVYLLLKGGKITRSSVDDCHNDENVIQLLEKIKTYPRKEYCTILNEALNEVDYAYVSRVKSTGTVTFRHDRIVEAVCLSFSNILPHEALKSVPFDFISKRVRTGAYETDLQDMIIIEHDRYEDLAERFERELKLGNVKAVCEHQSLNDSEFVNIFINRLCRASDALFLIQVSERAYGSTIDGSLLYWSASCGAEYLCEQILLSGIYAKVKDKFWVRTQASAALVTACWYGFVFRIIEKLLELGADVNSSIHSSRCFQTHTSNFLVVHEPKGSTPIQAVICGPNDKKANYIERLIENGCHFQYEKRMVRPLIRAVKQEDTHLVNVLLKHGVNVHSVDMWGTSAIQFALELNLIEIMQLLLQHTEESLGFVQPRSVEMLKLLENYENIDMTEKDDGGKSLLHCVEDPKMIDYLLEFYKELSVDMRDGSGRTPLYYAKTDYVVHGFLKHGASLSCVDNRTEDTFFHVHHNPVLVENVLKTLTQKDKTKLLHMKNRAGVTPIFTSRNAYRILLENGADVNVKCSYSPEREINEESIYKTKEKNNQVRSEIVSNFVHKIRSSTVFSRSHTTTVSSKSNYKDIENIETSENPIEGRQKLLATDITVVMMLISKGRLSIDKLDLALKYGYNFIMKDTNGRNLLHHLLSPNTHTKDIKELIERLLKHANSNLTAREFLDFLNSRDIYGETALYLACCCSKENQLKTERFDIVVRLLEFGADSNIANNNSEKPANTLMKCRCCPKSDIFQQLITEGKIHETDNISLVVRDVLRSCSASEYPGKLSENILNDNMDLMNFLLSTYHISIVCIMKYLVDINTDPNIAFLILQHQLYALNDNDKDNLRRICCDTPSKNSAICHLALQARLRGRPKHFEDHALSKNLQELFKYFVRKLQRKVLERILQPLFDNADIEQFEDDIVVWTIDNAPGCLKLYLLNFLLDKDVHFGKSLSLKQCIGSPDDENVTIECLKSLLKYGATLSTGSPLIQALKAEPKRAKVISFLLEHKEIDLDQQDETKQSVFYCFLEYFAKEVPDNIALPMFQVLLKRTRVITINDIDDNPLVLALKCKNLSESFIIEIMERLKDMSSINRVDTHGRTPLQNVLLYYYYNRESPELKIVTHIVKFGGTTDRKQVDAIGNNCVHTLVSRMKIDTLKILLYILEKDQEDVIETINAKDNDGNSVLHHACMVSTSDYNFHTSLRISVVRILLLKGADINTLNMDNQTVLHLLIRRCDNMSQQDKDTLLNPIIELINLLLEHGIDESIVDMDGKTAIQYLTDDLIGIGQLVEKNAKPEDLISLT